MDIDLEEINKFSQNIDKVIRLKARLIPIEDILKIAREIIKKDGLCMIKNLDNELQKVYIVNGRAKAVYFRFLLNIFRSELLNNSDIKYLNRKIVKKKEFTNVLVKK